MAQATKDIGTMIKGVQQESRKVIELMTAGVARAESGSADAENSGKALSAIREQVGNVRSQVNQIAVAAAQQTATTHEISGEILLISSVVSEGAAIAQESSAAAQQLNQLSEELFTVMRQFRLGSEEPDDGVTLF
ncbi:MAG: hypothetical protein A2075_22885 [Geobacteraceae bacterium GWC2_58_44]|nr:MAG: hypothetical protein A2075_22885 [Geobacteraceae bacterium GWC2_58_44]